MQAPRQTSDRHALVTGGSTGIGAAIARALAARGTNLVLVARNARQLEAVADEIRSAFQGVTVLPLALDLAGPGAVSRLLEKIDQSGVELEILVNSAGMSSRGSVVTSAPALLRRLVDLNVGALTELTTAVVARMSEHGHGSIVNIASTGGYAPAPVLAAYAASKAYVLSFTQALWAETEGTGIRVVAVSPGPTQTPMNPAGARGKRQADQVAATVLRALDGSGPSVVDGRQNAILARLIRLLPARLITRLALRLLSD